MVSILCNENLNFKPTICQDQLFHLSNSLRRIRVLQKKFKIFSQFQPSEQYSSQKLEFIENSEVMKKRREKKRNTKIWKLSQLFEFVSKKNWIRLNEVNRSKNILPSRQYSSQKLELENSEAKRGKSGGKKEMRGPRSFTFPSFVPFSFISMKSERAWVPLLPRRLVDHSRMFEMKFENFVCYPILNILKVR